MILKRFNFVIEKWSFYEKNFKKKLKINKQSSRKVKCKCKSVLKLIVEMPIKPFNLQKWKEIN